MVPTVKGHVRRHHVIVIGCLHISIRVVRQRLDDIRRAVETRPMQRRPPPPIPLVDIHVRLSKQCPDKPNTS